MKRIILVFFLINSFAQGNTTVLNDSINIEVPKAIPVVNILEEIEIATEKIKDLKRKTQSKSFIINIDSLYPTYKIFIAKKRLKAQNYISSGPNKQGRVEQAFFAVCQ